MAFVWMLVGIAVALGAAAVLVALYMAWTTQRIARRAERLVPPHGKFIEVAGCRIHYTDEGEGPPILMLHGLGAHMHYMRRPLLETMGQGFRVVAMDRPGAGYSTRAKGMDGRLTEQARVVAALIDRLGLDRPLMVGHSLGGAVALALALDHPEKVRGLALISPLTHFEQDPPKQFRPLAIHSPLKRRLIAYTIAIPMALKNAPRTIDFVFGPQQPPADFATDGGAMLGMRPVHFFGMVTDLVAIEHDLPNLERRYGELAIPVGVLFGTADKVLNHSWHGLDLETSIPGVDLEILEGVGHMPQYADPQRVAAFIRRIAARAFAEA